MADLGDKTEHPTGRRLANARSEGQVAKSTEFAVAVEFVGALLIFTMLGPGIVESLAQLIRETISQLGMGISAPAKSLREQLLRVGMQAAWLLAPALLLATCVVIAAYLIQVGWHPTTKPLAPKLSRLNPIAGLQRLFSLRGLVRISAGVLKLFLLALVAASVLMSHAAEIMALPMLGALQAWLVVYDIVRVVVLWILAILIVVGVADYAYQRWQHRHDLRMTKQEVKDERRNMEGDEFVKARRLQMARQGLLSKIREGVKTADVIVANPTHFAVAITYDAETMHAPKVTAKGADYMALRIRELAAEFDIPIIERPPLARALFASTEVGYSISPQFYQAVAEVLAYVYRLNGGEAVMRGEVAG